MNSCLTFYKNYYKGKNILLVIPDIQEDIYDLLNSQIENLPDDLNITIASTDKNFKFLGNEVIYYETLDQLFSIAEDKKIFKIFMFKKGYIVIGKEQYSMLWDGFLQKIQNLVDTNEYHYYKDLLQRLEKSEMIERFHFLSLGNTNSLYNEMYLLSGAGEGIGMVLVKKDSIYKPTIRKVSKYNDFQQHYIQNLFDKNKHYFKKKELDLTNDDIYVIALEKEIPIGMFEMKDIVGSDIKELGTVALDEELQGKSVASFLFEAIFSKLKDEGKKYIIVVTPNKNLKNILESFGQKKINKQEAERYGVLDRYKQVLISNKEDKKGRDMYLIDLHKFI